MGQFYYTGTEAEMELMQVHIHATNIKNQDISDLPVATMLTRLAATIPDKIVMTADIGALTDQEIVDKYPIFSRRADNLQLAPANTGTTAYAIPILTDTALVYAIPQPDDESPYTLGGFTYTVLEDTGSLFPPPAP